MFCPAGPLVHLSAQTTLHSQVACIEFESKHGIQPSEQDQAAQRHGIQLASRALQHTGVADAPGNQGDGISMSYCEINATQFSTCSTLREERTCMAFHTLFRVIVKLLRARLVTKQSRKVTTEGTAKPGPSNAGNCHGQNLCKM